MTGYEVYKKAMVISGYTASDNFDVRDDADNQRAVDIISNICSDLKCPSIEKLSDSINTSDVKTDALCYGTAMLISLCNSDGNKNSIFTELYNAKRANALSQKSLIRDNLPSVGLG